MNYLDISHLNHVYSVSVDGRVLKYTEVKVITVAINRQSFSIVNA